MTAPTEAEVRAWLKAHAVMETPEATAALALLDEARKDRERLEEALVVYHHALVTGNAPPVAAQVVARRALRKRVSRAGKMAQGLSLSKRTPAPCGRGASHNAADSAVVARVCKVQR